MNMNKLMLLALLAAPPALALSDTASIGHSPWSLQQCIDYALSENLDLKQQRIAVEQAEVDIAAREGALFPSLSFGTTHGVSWRPWSQQYVNITDGTFTSSSSELNYNGTYGLTAQWTLWNGGRNRKQLQRSKLQRTQAQTEAEATGLSLQEQVVKLYVQILYQTEGVRVTEQILESTQVQYERAKAMYEVGQMSKADLAQMEAQVSQEQYNVANAITQLRTFRLNLKQLLQLMDTSDFDVEIPVIDDQGIEAPLPAVADVYDQALILRPEIRRYMLGIEMADMDVDIARRGYYPTISVNAGINTSSTSGVDTDFGRQLKTNLSNSLGVTVSVPIFDNRTNSTNVARARLDRETAEIQLAQQANDLYSTVESIWLEANNAIRQYSSAVTYAASMRESYELVSGQFDVGLKDIVDLTTGKNNLLQAEQQLL